VNTGSSFWTSVISRTGSLHRPTMLPVTESDGIAVILEIGRDVSSGELAYVI